MCFSAELAAAFSSDHTVVCGLRGDMPDMVPALPWEIVEHILSKNQLLGQVCVQALTSTQCFLRTAIQHDRGATARCMLAGPASHLRRCCAAPLVTRKQLRTWPLHCV